MSHVSTGEHWLNAFGHGGTHVPDFPFTGHTHGSSPVLHTVAPPSPAPVQSLSVPQSDCCSVHAAQLHTCGAVQSVEKLHVMLVPPPLASGDGRVPASVTHIMLLSAMLHVPLLHVAVAEHS
jgi:hypothetical protein